MSQCVERTKVSPAEKENTSDRQDKSGKEREREGGRESSLHGGGAQHGGLQQPQDASAI